MTTEAPAAGAAADTSATAAAAADKVTTSTEGVVVGSSTGSDADKAAADKATSDWLATLDDEGRELAKKKNWKDQNAALKSYSELEKLQSKGTQPVAYKADDYKFTLPTNAKDIGYDENFANGFRTLATEAGISPEAAAKVHDWYTKFATDSLGAQNSAYATQVKEQVTNAQGALVKSWGAENNPVFKRNAELANRAITNLGAMDKLVEFGAIVVDEAGRKTVADAAVFEMFAKVGQAMYAEDTLHGPAVADGKNPFGPDGDQSAAGALIRNDPEKALLLISSLSPTDRAMWLPVLANIRARVKK